MNEKVTTSAFENSERENTFGIQLSAASEASLEHAYRNEDTELILEEHGFALVCDGVDGCDDGQAAAQEVKAYFTEHISRLEGLESEKLQSEFTKIVKEANAHLLQIEREKGKTLKTTFVAIKFLPPQGHLRQALVGSVGDSRAYQSSVEGELRRLTVDDSLLRHDETAERAKEIEDRLDQVCWSDEYQSLSLDEQLHFNRRHIITQALGMEEVDTHFTPLSVQAGDTVLLVSDGVWENLTTDEIKYYLASRGINRARRLVEAARDRSDQGAVRSKPDDATAVVIEVNELPEIKEVDLDSSIEDNENLSPEDICIKKEEALRNQPVVRDEILLGQYKMYRSIGLADGSHGVFRSENQDDMIRDAYGNEHHLSTIPPETYYIRDVAAYVVDKALRFSIVPVTVPREIGDEEKGFELGSLQEFVPGKSYYLASPEERAKMDEECREQFILLALFDYTIWNADRHSGNCLIDGEKLYAIDNSLAFETQEELSYFVDEKDENSRIIKDLDNVEVPDWIIDKFIEFLIDPDRIIQLRQGLHVVGLTRDDIESCLTRIEILGTLLSRNRIISSEDASSLLYYGRNPEAWKAQQKEVMV